MNKCTVSQLMLAIFEMQNYNKMCLVKSFLIENLENNYYKTNHIKMK